MISSYPKTSHHLNTAASVMDVVLSCAKRGEGSGWHYSSNEFLRFAQDDIRVDFKGFK